jgi:RNA polymerase sigma-70 factor (ECF subfamily)
MTEEGASPIGVYVTPSVRGPAGVISHAARGRDHDEGGRVVSAGTALDSQERAAKTVEFRTDPGSWTYMTAYTDGGRLCRSVIDRRPNGFRMRRPERDHLNDPPSPGVQSSVMNDPAVSLHASTSGAIVEQAAAFDGFFREQSPILYARLCLITGNRSEAEELSQDAFLKVWERWDRVAGMDEPVGYLYRTAMNLFRKRHRRAMLALRRTVSVELRRDEFAVAEDRSVVARWLGELAPRQRAALVLTELIGFSSDEAGRMLGVRPGTVRALASQGRAALKQHMEADDV